MRVRSKTPFSSISRTLGRRLSSANWRTFSRKRISSSVSETRGRGDGACGAETWAITEILKEVWRTKNCNICRRTPRQPEPRSQTLCTLEGVEELLCKGGGAFV